MYDEFLPKHFQMTVFWGLFVASNPHCEFTIGLFCVSVIPHMFLSNTDEVIGIDWLHNGAQNCYSLQS